MIRAGFDTFDVVSVDRVLRAAIRNGVVARLQANRKREIISYLTLEPPNCVELRREFIYLGLVIVTVSNSTNIAIVEFERVKVRKSIEISHCNWNNKTKI